MLPRYQRRLAALQLLQLRRNRSEGLGIPACGMTLSRQLTGGEEIKLEQSAQCRRGECGVRKCILESGDIVRD